MRSQMKKYLCNVVIVLLLIAASSMAKASDQSDVRATVQNVFEQLKSHNYDALYDFLPDASRNRMSRDRFVTALQRAQDFYHRDRMDIGGVKVMGDLAVVDTVLYGKVVAPIQAEGKIVAQQYLLREGGKWRVATGDQSSVRKVLADNPGFRKGFKIRPPRVYVKQNGAWVEFNAPRKSK